MLAPTKSAKLGKQLDELQARTSRRELSMDDITSAIEIAEEAIKSVRSELRNYVTLQYHPHRVAGAYSYRANGTRLLASFAKSGKVIKASVARVDVHTQEVFRLVINFEALSDFIAQKLLVEKPSGSEFSNKKAHDAYNLLRLIVLKESGFNQHGTMLL
jgi:hypothetical protein